MTGRCLPSNCLSNLAIVGKWVIETSAVVSNVGDTRRPYDRDFSEEAPTLHLLVCTECGTFLEEAEYVL